MYHFIMYKNGDNTYTKYRDDGIREDYDTQGRITSITDLNGNMITFTYAIIWYGGAELKYGLIRITDTVGRVITFSYSVGNLVSISDGVRTTTYSYSGDRLVAVTDPMGRTTTYDYMDANSFLITGVHYPTGGFSSYEYAAVVPEAAKLAPYKGSVTENGVPTYYASFSFAAFCCRHPQSIPMRRGATIQSTRVFSVALFMVSPPTSITMCCSSDYAI